MIEREGAIDRYVDIDVFFAYCFLIVSIIIKPSKEIKQHEQQQSFFFCFFCFGMQNLLSLTQSLLTATEFRDKLCRQRRNLSNM